MKRFLCLALALVVVSALAGCACYTPPSDGASLNVINPTELSWRLYIDGRPAGTIGPQASRTIRIGPGSHEVKAVDRLLLGVYNRTRIAQRKVDLGGIYSANQKVDFIIADYETRTNCFLWAAE